VGNAGDLNSMDKIAAFMRDNLPVGMSLAHFGKSMKWGRRDLDARRRAATITVGELRRLGLTAEQARNWAVAYEAVSRMVPSNPSARGRFSANGRGREAPGRRVTVPSQLLTAARQRVRLRNNTGKELKLWLEPLGDEVVLRSNLLCEMSATDEFGKVEIDVSNDGFVVYGWVTRIISIDEDGKERLEWELPG
jgi:hypothetical protein